ncbi:MAG: bifunctional phosphopantothenoylcysteine decarboxylase/phosphopantothenate--cysteine ligase CoaBC [Treponema sp.]|nr:bifunctional phosphopantothenoylcysteine decarboxylase/phosphopantothenate--cysteine ligase CoaBC [Candidatus Treponema equifaecale]
MLAGKTVVLGVTGSIAAYKAAGLTSLLVKNHADVHVIMTEHAKNIINPITFETLTGHKCLFDTFDRNFEYKVEHVSIAKKADIFVVAPATANTIAKLVHGIADDMLSTTFLACSCPKLISPAMNTQMYDNPVTQDNLEIAKKYGYKLIEPATGHLACGDDGKGKMPEPEEIFEYIVHEISCKKDLAGKKILVTAGPTQESLDPVRYITNHSTGKMGYAIAEAAANRGAEVVLVSGPVNIKAPLFVKKIDIKSAKDMFEAVKAEYSDTDIVIKAAAVADYRPAEISSEKIKKAEGDNSIKLERTDDILKYLGENKKNQFLCGFSMETQNMLENSKAKLTKKNLDMIVANNLKVAGAGFGTDTNVVTIITKDAVKELPQMSKLQVAHKLLDEILTVQQYKF